MNRTVAFMIVFALTSARAPAAELTLPRDGWVSWQLPAVVDAPAWCCFGDGRRPTGGNTSCRLDESQHGYSSQDDERTDSIVVYAHFAGGRLHRIRALAESCPVEVNGGISHLTDISDEASAHWLANLLAQKGADSEELNRRLRSDVTAALAIHRSEVAQKALVGIARNDTRFELRKEALFWLAHLRGRDGAQVVTSIMFDDANPKIREHAAFAVSQSKSPRIAAGQIANDLIRLGNTDRNTKVRAQAWFWLGQTGFPETEGAINAALKNEQDSDVREQAVFALSQLPDERATQALISVAENATLSRDDRKQAIFWLAQEGSDSALKYLDRIVTAPNR
jgi:HEAT repeat protein